jgi:hypothetical protein
MKFAVRIALAFFALCAPLEGYAQKIYAYVGRITEDSFLLAWGTAEGNGNTIGRSSESMGSAVVEADGRRFQSDRHNWVEVTGLGADTEYPYRLMIQGRQVGSGQVRTFPRTAQRLAFFVIGDYGSGKPPQYEIAEAMTQEFDRRRSSDNPVRFVLTTGDNIYSDHLLGIFATQTGSDDADWRTKFYEPYERLLREIPFYPTLGNHDRQARPGRSDGDLDAYLDNFFFPSNEASTFYGFSFGQLADFFALDTTALAPRDPSAISLVQGGGQFKWLTENVHEAKSSWKIAYFHHPPFSAGPNHEPSLDQLAHVVRLFKDGGVQVVFSGHEHNFQFANKSEITGDTLYVVSGAGGQLRSGEIYSEMKKSDIAGSSPERHFLLVEIDGRDLAITPMAARPLDVLDANRERIPVPIVVSLPSSPERN